MVSIQLTVVHTFNLYYVQSANPAYLMGALCLVGGVTGFARTRSIPSLVAGVTWVKPFDLTIISIYLNISRSVGLAYLYSAETIRKGTASGITYALGNVSLRLSLLFTLNCSTCIRCLCHSFPLVCPSSGKGTDPSHVDCHKRSDWRILRKILIPPLLISSARITDYSLLKDLLSITRALCKSYCYDKSIPNFFVPSLCPCFPSSPIWSVRFSSRVRPGLPLRLHIFSPSLSSYLKIVLICSPRRDSWCRREGLRFWQKKDSRDSLGISVSKHTICNAGQQGSGKCPWDDRYREQSINSVRNLWPLILFHRHYLLDCSGHTSNMEKLAREVDWWPSSGTNVGKILWVPFAFLHRCKFPGSYGLYLLLFLESISWCKI